MGHTPGPWSVSVDRISSDYGDIAAVHYQSIREQKGWHCMDDANLIAAAPELLAALKDLRAFVSDNLIFSPEVAVADRAIAKAEGRSE